MSASLLSRVLRSAPFGLVALLLPATRALAAESSIHVSNFSSLDAGVVVDGKYPCRANGTTSYPVSFCVFTGDCSNFQSNGRSSCVVASLKPGKHTIVVTMALQTTSIVANQTYFEAEDDEPAAYDSNCRITYTAGAPHLTCDSVAPAQ